MSSEPRRKGTSGPSGRVRGITAFLACASVVIASACAPGDQAGRASQSGEVASTGPSIVGSYHLVSRELPDGSMIEPPNVFGWMTFTKDHRLVYFYLDGPNGRYSVSLLAAYSLSDTAYDETRLYSVVNDEAQGAGPTYQLSPLSRRSPVTLGPGTVEFHDSGENNPLLVFTADSMTATAPGAFVDRWTKGN